MPRQSKHKKIDNKIAFFKKPKLFRLKPDDNNDDDDDEDLFRKVQFILLTLNLCCFSINNQVCKKYLIFNSSFFILFFI